MESGLAMRKGFRSALSVVLAFVTAIPAPLLGQITCKTKSVVLLTAGDTSVSAIEFSKAVHKAFSRYGCYKLIDVVDVLEAGLGEGLTRLDEALREAELGASAFTDARFESARDHFKAAVMAFSDGFAYLPYYGPLLDSLMSLGVCEAVLGETSNAQKAFLGALNLRKDINVEDWSMLPEAIEAFKTAKNLHETASPQTIEIESTPEQAEVYIDGQFAGITPAEVTGVPLGMHFIVVRKPGFVRKGVVVEVGPRVALSVPKITLSPARRKPLYDNLLAKIEKSQADSMEIIEDIKALFLTDMAAILRIQKQQGGWSASLGLWDLYTMEAVWSGTEPESGLSSELGRGGAESLVASAIAADEARARVSESGAATIEYKGGIHTKWWFWTIIGAVVIGGATAAILLTMPGEEERGLPHDGTGAVIIRF